jgi:hypothetical protein
MLALINLQVGGVSTDTRTKTFNFLSCLHAIATAAANSSPVVNPVNTAGVKNTGFNCITLLANTEAGGWSTGANNNVTANTAYANNTTSQVVDLYQSSGKSTYPYLRMSFGNFQYPFANTLYSNTANSQIEFVVGHTTSNPASATMQSDSGFWSSGTTSTGRNQRTTPNANWNALNVDGSIPIDVANTGANTIIACTSNYLFILLGENSTNDYSQIFYYGLRTTSPWESSITTNPPWVSFCIPKQVGNGRFNYYRAWAAGFTANGAISRAATLYGAGPQFVGTTGNNTTFLTCTNTIGGSQNVKNGFIHAATPPFRNTAATTTFRWDTPTTDPNTGLAVPVATPLVTYISDDILDGYASGVLPGILRGPATNSDGSNTYILLDEYTINNIAYKTVRINANTDSFFVKKA